MSLTILITGSTDGIGLETAKLLARSGHHIILHGRSDSKLQAARQQVEALTSGVIVDTLLADLSDLGQVKALAEQVLDTYKQLDVLINNAGVFKTPDTAISTGLDVRFVVNAIAPYYLTRLLLPVMNKRSRVVNLSSAAQATVDMAALQGQARLSDNAAYAQSKLLLTMWSRQLGRALKETGPMVVAVNPKSFLGSKMVKEAYGVAGGDVRDGADILARAALSEEFAHAGGQYFENDIGQFSRPHSDALDDSKVAPLVAYLDDFIREIR